MRRAVLRTAVLPGFREAAAAALLLAGVVHAHESDGGVTSTETTVRGIRPVHGASEQTISREQLSAAPRSGATDLLRLVPGVVASQHSGEGKAQQLFLRGFDAVHGQDIELNVAGLPVNEVSHLHALGYADLNWLIPSAVRAVKVTEGSARAWQGDFAVAGTVRYELGLEDPGVTLSVGAGAFGRTRLFAGVRPSAENENFGAVEWVRGDGFGPQRAFSRLSLLGQWAHSFDALKVRAVVASSVSNFESPGVVNDAAVQRGDATFFQAFGAGQGGQSARHQLLLGAELQAGGGTTTLEAYGLLIDLTLRNNFTGFLREPRGDGLEQRQATHTEGVRLLHSRHVHVGTETVSLELGASGRRDEGHQSQRGYDEVDGALRAPQFGVASNFNEAVEVRFIQSTASAWGEAAWAPGAWRFMVGGRVDVLHVALHDALAFQGQGGDRSAFGPHLGLKLGVERGFTRELRAFLSYGDGFRSPQARQLSDGERAPFVNVHGGELGLRLEFERVQASALGFVSHVANDFFFDHLTGTTTFTGPTLRGGGQASVTVRPWKGLFASAQLTVARAQLLDRDALLPYFAPVVGRFDASWTETFSIWGQDVKPRLGVGGTVLGPRPLPYAEFSRPVFLLDAKAGLRVGPIELTLEVQNLLDSRWRDGEFVFASKWSDAPTASLLPARQFSAGSPRTFFFNLELHL